MKKLSLGALIAGAVFFTACNGNSDNTGMGMGSTANAITDNTMATNDTSTMAVDNNTMDFAKEAATGGMMEVQLGNLAQQNSSTESIKDFGKMMVDDHTKINNDLKDLAAKKNIALPATITDDQQKDYDKLSKETGTDFDKDYVDMMVKDHKKDIDAFKKAGDNLTDADFKSFIVDALPTLQMHLDKIQSIQKKM